MADAEGFRFLKRFIDDIEASRASLDAPDAYFLGAFVDGQLVAVGGVTADPYVDEPTTGRLRHLYVHPTHRRTGIGRAVVSRLEGYASRRYTRLRLRTDTTRAATFYEALAYEPCAEDAATHFRILAGSAARKQSPDAST